MKYIILSLTLIFLFSISAQEKIKDDQFFDLSKDAQEEDSKDLGNVGAYQTGQLNWSIKKEVATIEKSLNNYDPLIQSLEEANSDLKVDLAEYLKNPNDQVLAAKITAKMSGYAKKIVDDVDKITIDQDVLLTVFSEINQKLKNFNGQLESKVKEMDSKVETYNQENAQLKKVLTDIAKRHQNESDPEKKDKLKQEFQKVYNKYNLSIRYKDGFTRHKEDYDTLTKSLQGLIKIFAVLHQAFETLIQNLSAEKKYLMDNIRLQADSIRVQKLVHEGISDGSRAVVKISQKLAQLYAQVDGFAKVHEKINRDMAKFADTTKILSSLVQQVEKAPFSSAPSVEKAMEFFAQE
jgi:regulator of replication initiation timing